MINQYGTLMVYSALEELMNEYCKVGLVNRIYHKYNLIRNIFSPNRLCKQIDAVGQSNLKDTFKQLNNGVVTLCHPDVAEISFRHTLNNMDTESA